MNCWCMSQLDYNDKYDIFNKNMNSALTVFSILTRKVSVYLLKV